MIGAGGTGPRRGAGSGPPGGAWGRLRRWFTGPRAPEPALADDGSLVVVGRAFEPAQADSAVVEQMRRTGVDVAGPLLLRHHLLLPDAAALEEARRLLAPEGYALTARDEPAGLDVRASRTQVITGLSAAQERSRMAGLAQRLGGGASGWDALAPPPAG